MAERNTFNLIVFFDSGDISNIQTDLVGNRRFSAYYE